MIYKFYEVGIDIMSDIKHIFKIFEEKDKIIDKHKLSQIGVYKTQFRPKTAILKSSRKDFINDVIQELDDFGDSNSERQDGLIFDCLTKDLDIEATLSYNNKTK